MTLGAAMRALYKLAHNRKRAAVGLACVALSTCVGPAAAPAQPAPLPEMCTLEHVAEAGRPAPCTGALIPPGDALDGALCLDARLPRCEELRQRDGAVAAERALQLSRAASEASARAERWEALARAPCPPAVTTVVTKPRGVATWVAVVAVVAALAGGSWLGWKVRGAADSAVAE